MSTTVSRPMVENVWLMLKTTDDADRRSKEGTRMGLKNGFRRPRPSDDEITEELESHIAVRLEHDGSDDAAARHKLGGELRTREDE